MQIVLISIVVLIVLVLLRLLWGSLWRQIEKRHRYKQCKSLRFLSVKIPKIGAARSQDLEVTDHIQSMKQNIELMNQVYKNFYAMEEHDLKTKIFGQPYASVELFIEKEVIKFVVAVPVKYLDNIDKMISSFYPGAVIEPIAAPKFLEAGKYVA